MSTKTEQKARPSREAVVDPEPEALARFPELQLAVQDGQLVTTFLRTLVRGFIVGRELENTAMQMLKEATANRATPPTTREADETVQRRLKLARGHKKAIVEHWNICGILSRLHKRVTPMRDRGADAADEAVLIWNTLHNTYVEDERRRAQAEEDRRRREAEDRERAERQKILDEMEAEALRVEAESPQLSDREEHFVELMATGFNAPEAAARAAGFKDPVKTSLRLIALPKILQAIEAKRKAAEMRKQAEAVKATPLDVQIEEVKPNIATGITHDRTTHSCEILDERAVLEAYRSGGFGVPPELFSVSQTVANQLARERREQLNRIPGLRYRKETRAI